MEVKLIKMIFEILLFILKNYECYDRMPLDDVDLRRKMIANCEDMIKNITNKEGSHQI
ncbi:hypothetical protein ES703_33199 [subsurface metagenome]